MAMFCVKCGKEIGNEAAICPFCGEVVQPVSTGGDGAATSGRKSKPKKKRRKKIIIAVVVSAVVIALFIGGVKFYQMVQRSKFNVPISVAEIDAPWMSTEAEAEHSQAVQEMGEQNRQALAERKKILESALFTSAQEYVLDVLEEASPDCEYTLTLDVSGYYGATDEVLAEVVDTKDAAKAFFDSEYRLLIEGNWRDVYGDGPEPLLKVLMEHGISGGLDWQFGGPCYTFDAGTGKTMFHPAEGY